VVEGRSGVDGAPAAFIASGWGDAIQSPGRLG
jgi:hypothetical protein